MRSQGIWAASPSRVRTGGAPTAYLSASGPVLSVTYLRQGNQGVMWTSVTNGVAPRGFAAMGTHTVVGLACVQLS